MRTIPTGIVTKRETVELETLGPRTGGEGVRRPFGREWRWTEDGRDVKRQVDVDKGVLEGSEDVLGVSRREDLLVRSANRRTRASTTRSHLSTVSPPERTPVLLFGDGGKSFRHP